MTGDDELLSGFAVEYRRAAEAAALAQAAAERLHAALFDFAGEMGSLVARLTRDGNPLGLAVRFVRRPPPHLAAPAGVHVEEAAKELPPAFAAVVLETPDLWFEVRSDPAAGVHALTNVPDMETYATKICGVVSDEDRHPHLVQRAAEAGATVVPAVNDAAQLLEAFLVLAGGTYARRAG